MKHNTACLQQSTILQCIGTHEDFPRHDPCDPKSQCWIVYRRISERPIYKYEALGVKSQSTNTVTPYTNHEKLCNEPEG